MKKLSETLQNKLILQADEAKTIGSIKLGEAVYGAVVSKQVVQGNDTFNHDELENAVHSALWRAACEVAGYHDLQSIDIQKVDAVVVEASKKLVCELEKCLAVDGKFGPHEELVLGQVK